METFKQLIKRRDTWNKLPEFNGRLHVTTRYYLRFSDGDVLVGTDQKEANARLRFWREQINCPNVKLEKRPELSVWPDDPDTTVEWALNQDAGAAMAGALLENLIFNEPIKSMQL